MNDDALMRGTVCPICGDVNPNGYYRNHESNQRFCTKHTHDQIDKWMCKPAKIEREKNWIR